ncbi:hypothetical protein HMPREF0004_4697 [Achromobacter piechaudii ATCC 43553]|uniref:Uncharacterized protein n=1 Tax=Achromobacter piechaudii ATCC 43553 TaxID=742159 RepID=D4XGV0_9BURK|nr:hypothetical protein HMPREF0004_4697 [Achromobacter piechaudii ATCC 43553]
MASRWIGYSMACSPGTASFISATMISAECFQSLSDTRHHALR